MRRMEERQRAESLNNSTKYQRDREEFYRKLAKWRSGPKEKVYTRPFLVFITLLFGQTRATHALYATEPTAVV